MICKPTHIQIVSPSEIQPSDDEVAAALAAVQAYLATEQVDIQPVAESTGWQRSAKLSVQGLRPTRTSVPARWNTIERLRRASGFYGVVGL
jgi:hypothetical protein